MDEPVAKKRKVDGVDKDNSPIIFSTPGLKPDTLLVVLGQEFHVHSLLLKLHSAFFRKFLDSPDKTICSASTGSVENAAPRAPSSFTFSVEISAFHNLLCAIYTRPYIIAGAAELLKMVELADYYCVLPILSRTLDGVMMNSPDFVAEIPDDPNGLFIAAAKLRNLSLFRESLVWVVGHYENPAFYDLPEGQLKLIAGFVYGRISTQATIVSQHILSDFSRRYEEDWNSNLDYTYISPIGSYVSGMSVNLPGYFKKLHEANPELSENCTEIGLLFENRLKLDTFNGKHRQCGRDGAEEHFLCAYIEDEYIPWNMDDCDCGLRVQTLPVQVPSQFCLIVGAPRRCRYSSLYQAKNSCRHRLLPYLPSLSPFHIAKLPITNNTSDQIQVIMSTQEQRPDTHTNNTSSQSGSAAVQRGGAGTEKTPADSDAPQDPSKMTNTTSVSDNVPDFATKKPGGNPGVLEGIRNEVTSGLGLK
ncbi:hypothetical protein BUE80_DR004880 [Diplocarpon rosae]|nr:hypothetical protein BUE80_DR004880 [Diplocarpon rosae]